MFLVHICNTSTFVVFIRIKKRLWRQWIVNQIYLDRNQWKLVERALGNYENCALNKVTSHATPIDHAANRIKKVLPVLCWHKNCCCASVSESKGDRWKK